MPPKPRIPAIRAMIRNVTTQLSMTNTPLLKMLFQLGATGVIAPHLQD
jgi:hypothetical protein